MKGLAKKIKPTGKPQTKVKNLLKLNNSSHAIYIKKRCLYEGVKRQLYPFNDHFPTLF